MSTRPSVAARCRLTAALGLLALASGFALAADPPARPAGKAADKAGEKPAAHKPAAGAGDTAPSKAGNDLEQLRDRLAHKLGAKPADSAGAKAVKVATRPTSHDKAPPPSPDPAPIRKAAPVAKAVDAAALAAAHRAESGHDAHWGYRGVTGPQAWGGLKPEFAQCANGSRQSPIDIRDGIGVDLEPVQFDYRASGFSVVDNGHTIQVQLGSGNSIRAQGRRFDLVQFHFHHPAEERIDGRGFDMSVHLVHRDAEGRLAVVAVLLDRGEAQPVVHNVWRHIPLEKGEEVRVRNGAVDLNHLLPPDRGYYTYMGSLTTPPCTEGVLWIVMRQPVAVSQEQIDIFARLYPMNARPVQAAAGRLIKQSSN